MKNKKYLAFAIADDDFSEAWPYDNDADEIITHEFIYTSL